VNRLFGTIKNVFLKLLVKKPDPLELFYDHIMEVEKKINTLALVLGRSKAREETMRSKLQIAVNKLYKLEEKIDGMGDENDFEKENLIPLKSTYEEEAMLLDSRLKEYEESTRRFEKEFLVLKEILVRTKEEGELLNARYLFADASNTIYSDKSGLNSSDGRSSLERLMMTVNEFEARAEAAYEFLPSDIRMDAKLGK